ncbi:MAG TPA: ABC transporter ATP-binding protein [Saprospiraceae bacterium]|nr:ABC transporter ATP-binding protein [Saprospiraceae bacterium]
MNYLTLENVSKSFGDKLLFKNINLTIAKGQKIALVAKNGTGKTTLLKVVAGTEPGEGENHKVFLNKNIKIGFLHQEPQFDQGSTVIEAIFDSNNKMIQAIKKYEKALLLPDREDDLQKAMTLMDDLKAWDFESKIKEVLSKLNILLDQQVSTLSGGQKKRLALAKILIEEPEFLILDEPTNHLDLEMIEWLEKYLQGPNLTIFMVTHDRYFLERVCDTIVELNQGNLYRYKGNYAEFLMKKATREENQAIALDKDKKLYKKELEWIRRMPKARGTKAKSRVDAFDIIKENAHKKLDNSKVQIEIKGARLGSKILEAEYISKAYGDVKIVENFHYKFKKKERVGIVGPNGAGKSTLLRMFIGQEKPDSGKIIIGDTVVFGFYTQEGIQLKEDKRVIDVVRDVAEYIPVDKGNKITAKTLLERFLFTADQHRLYVSQLSGGERRRLHLLTILMTNPNFLILDEPTNDLDIITLNILEEFLMDFPGCLIIVSHDRYFMDKVVDHLFVFEGDGKIKDYNGNYTEYRARKKQAEIEKRKQASPTKTKKEKTKSNERKLTYLERKELGRLEKEIEKLEKRKAEITEKFNNTKLSSEDIQKLSIELAQVNNAIDEKEMRWLELSEYV